MYIFYIDEAGCPGRLPSTTSPVQPILCIAGLAIPQIALPDITQEFLELKSQFNPNVSSRLSHFLRIMLHEIKGADLRRDIRKGNRNERRRALVLLDKTLDILDRYECKIFSRVYVKRPGDPFDGNAVYTSSIQTLCHQFNTFLIDRDKRGIVIADSRAKNQNNNVSFSVFTAKFRNKGDAYPNILEMPVFGHSENHVGLQIADWIASAILFPAISYVYCTGHIKSVHVNAKDKLITDKFCPKIKRLQYRYLDNGKYQGGISVNDGILRSRSSSYLFR